MASKSAVIVDDDDVEAARIAARLTEGGFPCESLHPPRTVEALLDAFDRDRPRLILLDYRLDDQSEANYRAGTVAAWLRERQPQIPIALVTTEEKLSESVVDNPQVRQLFDVEILKADLAKVGKDDNKWAVELTELIDAYAKISLLVPKDDWREVVELFGPLSEDESLAIVDCRPPGRPTRAPTVAQWIKREVLAYPGPLLDARECAVRLGISMNSFEIEPLQSWLADCSYTGVLSKSTRRWWRGRIEQRVVNLLGDDADFDSRIIASGISKLVKAELEYDTCSWCQGTSVARPCMCCGKAVDLSHCVAPDLADRPLWAEPSVVCFVCISDGTAEEIRFSPAVDALVHDIRMGKVERADEDG